MTDNYIAYYPKWLNNEKALWGANGTYINNKIDMIEDYENYTDYYYSFMVYIYQVKNKLKILKKFVNIEHKKVFKDKIDGLEFVNSTVEDLNLPYKVVVIDITSYLVRQPPLKLFCFVNNNESIVEIEFNAIGETSDITQREYSFDLKPFSNINFAFNIESMK